ncbi:phosphotransferase [Planctomycetales bacterium ZRK34]|nr:phosphotransferase [Planctomycetales bacterium ZRK34]
MSTATRQSPAPATGKTAPVTAQTDAAQSTKASPPPAALTEPPVSRTTTPQTEFESEASRWVQRSPGRSGHAVRERDAMIRTVQARVFGRDPEFKHYYNCIDELRNTRTSDYMFATPFDLHRWYKVFERLRWGGQFVFTSYDADQVHKLAQVYASRGFVIEHPPAYVRHPVMGMYLPGLGRKVHYFVARRVHLVRPGEVSMRFTYDVYLKHEPRAEQGYVVAKQVPDLETVMLRLKQRFPEAKTDFVETQAKKLIDTIFPVFLTREAAFLKILQRDLPEAYRNRVPRAVYVEKDNRGFVSKLHLNWLRKSGPPISQIDFALQAADLLDKLHEQARVIHLDLRLDNFVVTEHGVGFVDYGSAARVGENIAQSPLLDKLFQEMMKASQIQRMLAKMTSSGLVTSQYFTGSHQKVDKAADLFYLAVQIDKPHSNPDIKEMVRYDASSEEARLISNLTEHVLRPNDPKRPHYSSARNILEALLKIKERLR